MRILFIALGFFPNGLAISTRIVNYARLFHDCGFEVHVIADYTAEPVTGNEIQHFENCTYQAVTQAALNRNFKLSSRIFNANNSLKLVKKYIENNHVDMVVTSTCYDRFRKLRKLCSKHSLPLTLDITEWYDVSGVKYGKFNPFYMNYTRSMEKDFKTADKFFTISTLLHNYYAATGKETLRIPTILDTSRMPPFLKTENEKIRITYAGFSGRGKESFREILEALALLGENRKQIEVHVYGCSKAAFLARLGEDTGLFERVQETVTIKGRVPQAQVHEVFGNSDYSIFMRPNKHSNQAGFPTKLAESLTAGTPVICNDTGDIGLYLKNGVNGFLLPDSAAPTILSVFETILAMKPAETAEMRRQARETAEASFDYRNYIEPVKALFSSFCKASKEPGEGRP